jgi:hypothetical protein
MRQRFRTLSADLMTIDPGLTPPILGAELAKAEGRPIVREFPLRLLHPVSDAEIVSTLELCVDEVARIVRSSLRDHSSDPHPPRGGG